jgi:AMIN domain-containing protein
MLAIRRRSAKDWAMGETVQLKPRITIQTAIHFDCPDRATFFAEYSRQLRRGEIFLEVAQKIPVGTPVEVHFRFLDCDATVELSGEIYRHRRRLDRLEAAVQFLNPEALQRLLQLSENELSLEDEEEPLLEASGVGLASEMGPTSRPFDDEQDTTKLLALSAHPEMRAGARTGLADEAEAPGERPRRPGASDQPEEGAKTPPRRLEDEELEATKAMPSWGEHWLGLSESARGTLASAAQAPDGARVELSAAAPSAGIRRAPRESAESRGAEKFGPSKAELAEAAEIAEAPEDEEDWFDLAEQKVIPLLGDAAPRRRTSDSSDATRTGHAAAPAAEGGPVELDENWLRVLGGPPPAAPESPPSQELLSEMDLLQELEPPASASPPIVAAPLESVAAPPPARPSESNVATGPRREGVEEQEVDLDEWDWNFLQSAPKPDAAALPPEERAAPAEEELWSALPVAPAAAGAEEPGAAPAAESAAPEGDEFDDAEIEFEFGSPSPAAASETKGASASLRGAAESPPQPKVAPVSASAVPVARPFSFDMTPMQPPKSGFESSPAEASTGEWPTPEEPFDAVPALEEDEIEELEPVSERRSRWGGRLGLLAVAALLLGGTAAVVLEPGWFSSLLGGGESDLVDLSKRHGQSGSTIPNPLVAEVSKPTPHRSETSGSDRPSPARISSPVGATPVGRATVASPSRVESDVAVTAPNKPTPERPRPTEPSASTPAGGPETIDLEADESRPSDHGAASTRPSPAPSTSVGRNAQGLPTAPVHETPAPLASQVAAAEAVQTPGAATEVVIQDIQVSVEAGGVTLLLTTDGKVSQVLQSEAQNPNRLIFDVIDSDCRAALAPKSVGRFGVERVRFGLHEKKLRIVLDLSGAIPSAQVDVREGTVSIRVTPSA